MTDFASAPIGSRVDIAIRDAKAGVLPMAEMIRTVMAGTLAVPSGGAVRPDGEGFLPLLFDRGGVQMVACYTDRSRIGDAAKKAPYCLELPAGEFLRRVPANYGVVVNAGQDAGFEIDPDGVRRIVAEFV